MQEVVMVSSVENSEQLKANIARYFNEGRYFEITQAIGMHSLLIDPQHTMADQAVLYRFVLTLIKEKIRREHPKSYASWMQAFPTLMAAVAAGNTVVTDRAAADVVTSRMGAHGPFTSVDAFFFWALDDRRLALDEIMKYIEATVARFGK